MEEGLQALQELIGKDAFSFIGALIFAGIGFWLLFSNIGRIILTVIVIALVAGWDSSMGIAALPGMIFEFVLYLGAAVISVWLFYFFLIKPEIKTTGGKSSDQQKDDSGFKDSYEKTVVWKCTVKMPSGFHANEEWRNAPQSATIDDARNYFSRIGEPITPPQRYRE